MIKNCREIIAALESTFRCHVSFHDYDGRITTGIGEVPLYHRNPVCEIVRASGRCFQYCCEMEAQLSRQHLYAVRQPFFKCCHAGIYELAVPVFYGTGVTGIMFAGPFLGVENEHVMEQKRREEAVRMIDTDTVLPALNRRQASDMMIFAVLIAEKISSTFERGEISGEAPHELKIRYFIDREFRRDPCLGTLADYLKVSESRVCQLMRQHFNRTFSEILAFRRVEHAQYLLKNSRMKIAAVASDSGFNDPVYFFRTFKRLTRLTPGQYRQQFQPEHLSSSSLQA